MEFAPQQERALDAVAQWVRGRRQPFFYLAGYAGTGKTTLARHFASQMEGDVLFASFTGKAASVMRSKGCVGATTLHKLIYTPSARGTGTLRHLMQEYTKELEAENRPDVLAKLQKQIDFQREELRQPLFKINPESNVRQASLVIIDECSMVSKKMGEDLLGFGVPVLVLGDPAQLPPVGSTGFFTANEPDFMLTDVHRQARESGILRLATEIREGKPLRACDYGDAQVVDELERKDEVLEYDQILVGRNKTRRGSNARYRQLTGREKPYPEVGEKLVCLKNNHDLGLLNGEIYEVTFSSLYPEDPELVELGITNPDLSEMVTASMYPFRGQDVPVFERTADVQEFDYGYCLTVHKSQGSQWPSVLVFDQSSTFGVHRRNHLYTAVTRASENVKVVRL
jgi:exodeoxyribonuclease-5